jgi:hypothetical protein
MCTMAWLVPLATFEITVLLLNTTVAFVTAPSIA